MVSGGVELNGSQQCWVVQGCIMNAEYLSPTFDKVLDVFATRDKQNARVIEAQYTKFVL
jgi:hypothetical protein